MFPVYKTDVCTSLALLPCFFMVLSFHSLMIHTRTQFQSNAGAAQQIFLIFKLYFLAAFDKQRASSFSHGPSEPGCDTRKLCSKAYS